MIIFDWKLPAILNQTPGLEVSSMLSSLGLLYVFKSLSTSSVLFPDSGWSLSEGDNHHHWHKTLIQLNMFIANMSSSLYHIVRAYFWTQLSKNYESITCNLTSKSWKINILFSCNRGHKACWDTWVPLAHVKKTWWDKWVPVTKNNCLNLVTY